MERIDQIDGPPVIGRHYLVPCVYWTGRGDAVMDGQWLPIIGPEHDDTEIIGFNHRHWHPDVRFLSRRQLEARSWSGDPAQAMLAVVHASRVRGDAKYRPRKCRHRMPDFPLSDHTGMPSPFAERLEDAYLGHRLRPGCAVCPHRGVPLSGLPAVDGVVVCPGHGLAWNTSTGELVRRVKSAEPRDAMPEPARA